jgi:hypothetical protein
MLSLASVGGMAFRVDFTDRWKRISVAAEKSGLWKVLINEQLTEEPIEANEAINLTLFASGDSKSDDESRAKPL